MLSFYMHLLVYFSGYLCIRLLFAHLWTYVLVCLISSFIENQDYTESSNYKSGVQGWCLACRFGGSGFYPVERFRADDAGG